MATTKPTKPNITLPPAFGTSASNVKTAYTAQELIDGYSASIQQILDGGNVNWLNDTFFKYLTYTTALCDWLNGCGTKQIPYINSSNQLDYYDLPAGIPIGQIIQVNCTADYIPDGCLPCDGQEYTKAQFNSLWTNYLTSSPAKLLTCSYADYQTDITTYGQCAKFAIDTTNNVFKVPTIKDGSFIQQANSNSELGKAYNAGLPNITGKVGYITENNLQSGAFYREQNGVSGTLDTYWTNRGNVHFNAALSNPIYGNSSTVQPNSVALRFFVVVSNGQINQASIDWSQWATETTAIKNATNFTATGKSTLAGLAMPSNTWIDISSHTWDTWYEAPANGYVFIQRGGSGNLGVSVSSTQDDNNIVWMQCCTDTVLTGNGKAVAAPVHKGQYYKFWGSMTGTIFYNHFTYAEGEV